MNKSYPWILEVSFIIIIIFFVKHDRVTVNKIWDIATVEILYTFSSGIVLNWNSALW